MLAAAASWRIDLQNQCVDHDPAQRLWRITAPQQVDLGHGQDALLTGRSPLHIHRFIEPSRSTKCLLYASESPAQLHDRRASTSASLRASSATGRFQAHSENVFVTRKWCLQRGGRGGRVR
jgi:hypothetical protein